MWLSLVGQVRVAMVSLLNVATTVRGPASKVSRPAEAAGTPYVEHPGGAVVTKMIELGRPSRLKGAGFYEYVDGRRQGLWPGLAEAFPPAAVVSTARSEMEGCRSFRGAAAVAGSS